MLTLGHQNENQVRNFFNATGSGNSISKDPISSGAKSPLIVIGQNQYGDIYQDDRKIYWIIQRNMQGGLFWTQTLTSPIWDQKLKNVAGFYYKKIKPILDTMISGHVFMLNGSYMSLQSSQIDIFKDIQNALETYSIPYDYFIIMYKFLQSVSEGNLPNAQIGNDASYIAQIYGFGYREQQSTHPQPSPPPQNSNNKKRMMPTNNSLL